MHCSEGNDSISQTGYYLLFPKLDKDSFLVDNRRPIPLLTADYKILALVYTNRLKFRLNQVIAETQSGFVKYSNIIRLILDSLYHADFVHSKAIIIIFLYFYKALDTIEQGFLLQSRKLFGFGDYFVNVIEMCSKGIIYLYISFIRRGVGQGYPGLLILVTGLL